MTAACLLGLVVPAAAADPYASWDVEVRAAGPGVLEMLFDSPLLQRRVHNTVYLPGGYAEQGPPAPVLYYLHGTVFTETGGPPPSPAGTDRALAMVTDGETRERRLQSAFAAQRPRARFVLVAPDTDPAGRWCRTCLWIDGSEDVPVGVPAESHLHEELMPLVEHLFAVRSGREGRGVIGFSMGGAGALIQGMRHPDRFAYVGSISGAYELLRDPGVRAIAEAVGYFRDQGYGTGLTDAIHWRNVNPADLAGNLAGQSVELMLSAGDGCLPPAGLTAPDCAGALVDPGNSALELTLRANNDRSIAGLGVPATQVRLPGVHGSNTHRVYADAVVPTANAVFADPPAPSPEFAYRTVDREFTIHGYDVAVQRPAPQFLALDRAAATAGRSR